MIENVLKDFNIICYNIFKQIFFTVFFICQRDIIKIKQIFFPVFFICQRDIIKITKKKFEKSLMKDQNQSLIKILPNRKRTENANMFMKVIRIFLKIRNKRQLNIDKDIIKCEKIKICYKYLKGAISYPFIQTKTKINFLKKVGET